VVAAHAWFAVALTVLYCTEEDMQLASAPPSANAVAIVDQLPLVVSLSPVIVSSVSIAAIAKMVYPDVTETVVAECVVAPVFGVVFSAVPTAL
jgi:uncharacterized membrane protein